jgi:hypothetical protein
MSFFTRRSGPPAASPAGIPAPIDNQPLIACCRHLADRARARDADPATDKLQHDLLAVGLEFDRMLADPQTATEILAGDRPWPVAAPHLLNLLLAAAGSALVTDPSLTGLIADTVLLTRRGSRAAWRLRAQAHEQWGDLNSAIAAHEEYLARTDVDKLGISTHVSALRELRDTRVELASALIDAHEVGDTLPMPGAADLHDLLSRPVRQETLEPVLEEFLADLTRLPVSELTAVRDVLHTVVHCLRTSRLQPPPLPAEAAGALAVLRLGDLRSWLAGRSICLVADPDRMAASGAADLGLGARIDGYDLVARFAAGPLDATNEGTRTDVMVLRSDQASGWDQPADLRLVLAEDADDWVRSVRRNLVPGAQRGLFDKTLRRPARQPLITGANPRPERPTAVFELLCLLEHLDVSPTIDLIGFGPGEVFADVEQDWLRPRIRSADEHLVSLR